MLRNRKRFITKTENSNQEKKKCLSNAQPNKNLPNETLTEEEILEESEFLIEAEISMGSCFNLVIGIYWPFN